VNLVTIFWYISGTVYNKLTTLFQGVVNGRYKTKMSCLPLWIPAGVYPFEIPPARRDGNDKRDQNDKRAGNDK